MEGPSYFQPGAVDPQADEAPQATPAGNNPSTYAGIIVLGALVVLLIARRSFSRYL